MTGYSRLPNKSVCWNKSVARKKSKILIRVLLPNKSVARKTPSLPVGIFYNTVLLK